MDLSAELDVAVRAAHDAGALLREHFSPAGVATEAKSRRQDVVTAADRDAEALVLGRLRDRWPADAILAEESGASRGATGRRWCVDPLDGTANFAGGVPHWAVAIALLAGEEPVLAVTHDPLTGETCTATADGPARLDGGAPLGVRRTEDVEDALVADNLPFDRREPSHPLGRALRSARGRRETGSMALDLAWVARGRFDAIAYRRSASLWDYVGGELLVRRAGGVVLALAEDPDIVVAACAPLATKLTTRGGRP